MSAPSDGIIDGMGQAKFCVPRLRDGIRMDLRAIQTHANALYTFASREIDNIANDELEAAAKPSFEAALAAALIMIFEAAVAAPLTMTDYSASSMIEAHTEATTTRKRKLRSGESYTMRFVAAMREPRSDNPVSLQDPGTSSHHEFNT